MGSITNKIQKIKYYRSLYFWGLVFLPLFYWPAAPVPYEVPKGVFLGAWVVALCIYTIWRVISQKMAIDSTKLRLLGLSGAFLVVSLVASLAGVDPTKSWWGNYYRVDGLVYSMMLLVFALTVSLVAKWERPALVAGIRWGSLFVSLWADVQWVLWGFSGHPAAGLGNTNFLAGYLAVTLVFWLPLVATTKRALLGIGLILIAIIATGSSGGLLVAGMVLVLWVVFDHKLLLSVFTALLLLGAIWVGSLWFENYQTRPLDAPFVAESRERIFAKLGLAVLAKPLLGWGVANVDYAFEANPWPIAFLNDIYVDKAHSHLLEVLVTTGIVGEVVYVGLLSALFWVLVSRYRGATKHKVWYKVLTIGFIAYVVHTQTNVVSVAEDVIFWTILGLA